MAKIINDAQPMREVEQDIVAYINGDDGLGKQLADIQSDVDANKQGVAENKQAIADLSDSVDTSEQTLGAAIQKNATDISAANTAIEKNAADITSANTAIQKNATDIESANTAIEKNAADITSANTAIQKNTADITSANTVIQKNATDIESANTAIEKNAADITSANTAIKKNAADIASANTAIMENGGKIDVINQTIDQMSQETEASLEGKQAKLTASAPITLDDSGKIGVSKASAKALGVVKIGNGISISNEGAISSEVPNPAVNTNDTNLEMTAWSEATAREDDYNVGPKSHSEGDRCVASGECSHAEGTTCTASGPNAHAEGESTTASGVDSHAEGANTRALATDSHAEGRDCKAFGVYSHAQNFGTIAYGRSTTAIGEYNIDRSNTVTPNSKADYALIIGNGSSYDQTSDAHTVTWDGTAWYAGDVTCDAVKGNHENLYSMRAMGAVVASTPSMEYGTSNSVSVAANSHTLVDITFGTAKTETPIVFTSVQHATAGVNLICTVQSVTNQQASLCVTNLGTTDVDNITIDWLALSGR